MGMLRVTRERLSVRKKGPGFARALNPRSCHQVHEPAQGGEAGAVGTGRLALYRCNLNRALQFKRPFAQSSSSLVGWWSRALTSVSSAENDTSLSVVVRVDALAPWRCLEDGADTGVGLALDAWQLMFFVRFHIVRCRAFCLATWFEFASSMQGTMRVCQILLLS